MTKRVKVTLISLGVIVAATLLAILIEHVRGRRALRAWVQQMEAQGEVFDIAKLIPKAPPPESNAAPPFFQAVKELEDQTVLPRHFPPMMISDGKGHVTRALSLEEWETGSVFSEDKIKAGWVQLEVEARAAEMQLTRIRAALELPAFHSGDHYTRGFVDFDTADMTTIFGATRWLVGAALCDLRQGRLDEALTSLEALSRLTGLVDQEQLIISQLLRISVARLNYQVTWEALQLDGWTDGQLAAIQSFWGHRNYREAMAKSLQMEQAMTRRHFELLITSKADRLKMLDQKGKLRENFGMLADSAIKQLCERHLLLPLWRVAWADQDALNGLQKWHPLTRLARESVSKHWSAVKTGFDAHDSRPWAGVIDSLQPDEDPRGLYDRLRFRFSGYGFGITSIAVRKAFAAETDQQLVATAIALLRFHLRHGNYPEDLAGLVPDWLPAAPVDCLTGEPLDYHREAEGGFLLQSKAAEELQSAEPADRHERLVWRQLK